MANINRTLYLILGFAIQSHDIAWGNGPQGNTQTNQANECSSPPYSTHDWIADKALSLLPEKERQWIEPHKTLYLLGTEAPDNDQIPEECNAPNTGYDDRRKSSFNWAIRSKRNNDMSITSLIVKPSIVLSFELIFEKHRPWGAKGKRG